MNDAGLFEEPSPRALEGAELATVLEELREQQRVTRALAKSAELARPVWELATWLGEPQKGLPT